MSRAYLIGILQEVEDEIVESNPTDDDEIPKLLIKLGFVRDLIKSGEIRSLKAMVVYILYTSQMRINTQGEI